MIILFYITSAILWGTYSAMTEKLAFKDASVVVCVFCGLINAAIMPVTLALSVKWCIKQLRNGT